MFSYMSGFQTVCANQSLSREPVATFFLDEFLFYGVLEGLVLYP